MKFKLIGAIKSNGKYFPPGTIVEPGKECCKQETLERLVGMGKAERVEDTPVAEEKSTKKRIYKRRSDK